MKSFSTLFFFECTVYPRIINITSSPIGRAVGYALLCLLCFSTLAQSWSGMFLILFFDSKSKLRLIRRKVRVHVCVWCVYTVFHTVAHWGGCMFTLVFSFGACSLITPVGVNEIWAEEGSQKSAAELQLCLILPLSISWLCIYMPATSPLNIFFFFCIAVKSRAQDKTQLFCYVSAVRIWN